LKKGKITKEKCKYKDIDAGGSEFFHGIHFVLLILNNQDRED
jgi:hypothetical protein